MSTPNPGSSADADKPDPRSVALEGDSSLATVPSERLAPEDRHADLAAAEGGVSADPEATPVSECFTRIKAQF